MKFISTILPLAALSSAFVLPDERMTQTLLKFEKEPQSILSKVKDNTEKAVGKVQDTFDQVVTYSSNAFDNAINTLEEKAQTFECHHSMSKFDISGFLSSTNDAFETTDSEHPKHPKHRNPHHGHSKPNLTVYQLIAESKYTTKLAKLINEYPDLVKTLNGTAANYTVFAPTDKAFEKIPHHGDHKPSKELIEKVLSYHVSPDFYPAGRVLVSHTIPTALEASFGPQRLRVGLGLKGLAVNFYSRIIAINIFGTNGVIHGVDSLLLPPPPAKKIIELLPGEFSTFQLALVKTGLSSSVDAASHTGGTFFIPNNWAFKKLGPRINAFLFSSHGEKYLKALLQYHLVVNQTLYSDAYYKAKSTVNCHDNVEESDIPKGHYHVDLPTLLEDKSLSIDVARWGGWITIKINGFSSVTTQDGIAADGVIHVLSNVLIPPKMPGGEMYAGGEMGVAELKERFEGYVGEL